MRLEPAVEDPRCDLILNGKRTIGMRLESSAQFVSVDFERDAVVSAAVEKAANIEFGKAGNTELAVLFHVNQLVKQSADGDGIMEGHNVLKGDRLHEGEIRQVGKAHAFKHGIEIRIADAFLFKDHDLSRLQQISPKKSTNRSFLCAG